MSKARHALHYVEGTNHNDTVRGTDKGDYLAGLRGDDILLAGKGNDDLGGDQGNDTYNGGLGNDLMVDQKNGNDTFIFNGGYDSAIGGKGADTFVLGKQLGSKAYTAEIEDYDHGTEKIVFYNNKPVQHITDHFVQNTEYGMLVHIAVGGKQEHLILDGYKYADYGDGTGDVWQTGASQPVDHSDTFFF